MLCSQDLALPKSSRRHHHHHSQSEAEDDSIVMFPRPSPSNKFTSSSSSQSVRSRRQLYCYVPKTEPFQQVHVIIIITVSQKQKRTLLLCSQDLALPTSSRKFIENLLSNRADRQTNQPTIKRTDEPTQKHNLRGGGRKATLLTSKTDSAKS